MAGGAAAQPQASPQGLPLPGAVGGQVVDGQIVGSRREQGEKGEFTPEMMRAVRKKLKQLKKKYRNKDKKSKGEGVNMKILNRGAKKFWRWFLVLLDQ